MKAIKDTKAAVIAALEDMPLSKHWGPMERMRAVLTVESLEIK